MGYNAVIWGLEGYNAFVLDSGDLNHGNFGKKWQLCDVWILN